MWQFRKGPNLAFSCFFIFWTIYFGIVWAGAIQVHADGWYAAYLPHWGDGAAHLSYMASFAFKSLLPTMHPLFLFHPFTYSFAADFIGGLMTRIGIPLWLAYNLWGYILSIGCIFSLWMVLYAFTRSKTKTLLTTTLFLTSGGLGWKYLILDRMGITTPSIVSYFPILYTQRETAGLVWLNVIVGELIPQRAFLLAIPLAVFLLITWYRQFLQSQPQSHIRLILSGVIFGVMPVIHPHTTMVLALTIAWWGIYALYKKQPFAFKNLLFVGLPAVCLGLYLTLKFVSPATSSGFFRWYPGWLSGPHQTNWIIFWIDNWGLFLPLAMIGTWLTKDKILRQVLYPFWLWFILANLFLFQPYDWDNAKILTWIYLIFTIPVANMITLLWQGKWFNKSLAVISFIILTLAGGIDAAHMLDTNTYRLKLVSQEEVQLAEQIKVHTSPSSVILTSTTHRNWVPILTGRQILCGYLGWMWTYGIDADSRVQDIQAIYAGSNQATKLLTNYEINYVVIGPEERQEFKINDDFFITQYPVILQTTTTTVYQIAPL